MDFNDLPKVKWNKDLLRRDKALIGGEEHPQFIGKIVKMMKEGTQPRILVLADPGHGKTWACGRLGEILHNELDVLVGDFDPDYQMTMDPLHWSRSVRNSAKKIFFMPDVDAVLPSGDYNSPKNKANRQLVYLSRRFGNPLTWDAHEMAKCPKAVRTNHNIRLVAVGNGDTYKFKAMRVKRKNDSKKEELVTKPLGNWKPDKPSESTRQRIEELDEEEKESQLIDSEEAIEMKRKKEEIKQKAFS
ncbi:MAG: hypothetical protein ABEJ02_03020 [Candidatus Paceibacteria bacterium]